MWTVVLFESDNTVNVVPNFWYSNGTCQWPKRNFKKDTKNMIKRRINHDEATFNSYKARPLLENIGKYYSLGTYKLSFIDIIKIFDMDNIIEIINLF